MTPRSQPPPLYNPAFEHDGCGTGFIANVDGRRTHRVVQLAVEALESLTHRGAVSSDASGDGAGVTIQIPHALLAQDAARFGLTAAELDRLAVAMVFLPADDGAATQSRRLLEEATLRSDLEVLGWRRTRSTPRSRLVSCARR